jgi:chaperonin GroES
MSKLDERKKQYDMPRPAYLPLGKNVLIYRLEGEEKTVGGIVIPQTSQEVKSRGILLAAGLQARDVLADGLIDIGDEVCFAHYAGRDREVEKREGKAPSKILECKVEDILGSVDALDRIKDYDIVPVTIPETGETVRIYQKKGK